jgi:hypothetical protein
MQADFFRLSAGTSGQDLGLSRGDKQRVLVTGQVQWGPYQRLPELGSWLSRGTATGWYFWL